MKKYSFTRFVATMSFNASVAGLGILILPLAVGALAHSGMKANVLGVLAFLELGAAAVTAVAASTRAEKTDPIALCILGAVLAAAGNFGSTFGVDNSVALLLTRPIAGIGAGLMTAGGLAVVARIDEPERTYGFIGMAPCVSALVGFMLAPYLIQLTGGAAGLFAFQGVLAVLNGVVMVLSRRGLIDFSISKTAKSNGLRMSAGKPLDRRTLFLCLASSLLLSVCDTSIWAFVAPLAQESGISLSQMGGVLTAAAILGVGGPLLAGHLGSRIGLAAPLTIGQAAMMGLSVALVLSHNPILYQVALYARVFAILFLKPMYQGLYARVDNGGRVVAAAAGFSQFGSAVGPLLGGMFVDIALHHFLGLAFVAVAASGLSLAMTYMIFSRRRTFSSEPALLGTA